MHYPDHQTQRMLVDRHQADVRRDARPRRRDPEETPAPEAKPRSALRRLVFALLRRRRRVQPGAARAS